jgi:hypothetical protein
MPRDPSPPSVAQTAVARTASAQGGLPPPTPVRCHADALHLLALAVSRPFEPETLCFVLDAHGVGGVVTVVSGTTTPESVLHVVEFMARAAQGVPRAVSLVAASVRPGGGVLPGDIDRWLEASDIAQQRGVTLLEWYVIGPGGFECPRDLLGEPERWPRSPCSPA